MNDKKLYAHRDIEGQKQFYLDHIYHMTSESLHSKSDIAAELAHRDIIINELLEALEDIIDSRLLVGLTELHDKVRDKAYAAIAKAKGES